MPQCFDNFLIINSATSPNVWYLIIILWYYKPKIIIKMKKYLVVLAVAIFTIGFTSCEPESAQDDQLYEQASDKDEEPDREDDN